MQPVPEEIGVVAGPPPQHFPLAFAGSGRGNVADRVYGGVLLAMGLAIPLLLGFLLFRVGASAWPAIRAFGWSFLASSEWNPVAGEFGALPFIFGTLASSLLAVLIAVPLAVGLAIFLTELAPRWLATPIAFGTELLAAIPSVVYGLWGIFVLVPWLRFNVQEPLARALGDTIPLFRGPAYGVSVLSAGVILAIMIVPFISAVSREVLAAVPRVQREGALALGATRWEMTWQVVLPYATPGIIGAVILGLGRALGETMAVTMVIGNRPEISASLFAPGYTMASVLANEFAEASSDLYLAALMEIALILFGITIVVNTFARLLVWRVARRGGR
ncbi:MAG TPA: phosphate ABC transporter permease subunit PstC [Longimicrobiaceae bacterium]|nr:phosphate ABC transporter permease subunit PstC [Longimicrobiaceae bacterium]